MSNIVINVEFLAGTKIEDCIIEAKEKAKKFDVAYVRFKFNGKSLSIGRNADVGAAIYDWRNGKSNFVVHS